MREFIDIVESVGQRILYHGTSIPNAAYILKSNHLIGQDDHDGPTGVSFTREEPMAWSFSRWKSEQEATAIEDNTDIKIGEFRRAGAVMAFDWEAIERDLKISPHQWDRQDDEEAEERVLGDFPNLNLYLLWVSADQDAVKAWASIVDDSGEFTDGAGQVVLDMLTTPKFRGIS